MLLLPQNIRINIKYWLQHMKFIHRMTYLYLVDWNVLVKSVRKTGRLFIVNMPITTSSIIGYNANIFLIVITTIRLI
jgi:pyruvate/2-oxoglutarate/acetoin dehydrogenase E1 component